MITKQKAYTQTFQTLYVLTDSLKHKFSNYKLKNFKTYKNCSITCDPMSLINFTALKFHYELPYISSAHLKITKTKRKLNKH
jgi:hypothetical protein